MGKRIVWLVAGLVLAASLGATPPPSPTAAPPGPQAIQQVRMQASRLAGSQWSKIEQVGGAGIAVARPADKMIWLGALAVPGQRNLGEAGFKLGALRSDTAMPGATAKVTFEIHLFEGEVTCKVVVAEDGVRQVGFGSWRANAATSHDVTTSAFTMQPGKSYTVHATVLLEPGRDPGHPGASAVVKVPDIGWQL